MQFADKVPVNSRFLRFSPYKEPQKSTYAKGTALLHEVWQIPVDDAVGGFASNVT